MATQTINSESLLAIAHARLGLIYQPKVDDGAAGVARNAIIWSERTDVIMARDGLFTFEDGEDRNAAHNQVGDYQSFKLGFNLALELGARIATDPLGQFDVVDLIERAEAYFIGELKRARSEHAKRGKTATSPAA